MPRLLADSLSRVDVTDEEEVERALESSEQLNGKARILVNCAGLGPPGKAIGRDGKALPLRDFTKDHQYQSNWQLQHIVKVCRSPP